MAGVTFQREEFSGEFMGELFPLAQKHNSEVGCVRGENLSPAWGLYDKINELGRLYIYTARKGGDLIGYAVYLVAPHPHHDILVADADLVFVLPEERKGRVGTDLLKFAEEELRDEGVAHIKQAVRTDKRDFSPILKRDGYRLVEHIYMKRL